MATEPEHQWQLRAQIRGNITEALVSLRVDTVDDTQQIAAALAQCTVGTCPVLSGIAQGWRTSRERHGGVPGALGYGLGVQQSRDEVSAVPNFHGVLMTKPSKLGGGGMAGCSVLLAHRCLVTILCAAHA